MRAGDIVGERFELLSVAGQGGMGVVWCARDMSTGAAIALKVLRARSATLLARFQREARVLGTLKHSGIVAYVAHGTTSDHAAWLAMEWLEGEELDARLKRGALSVDDTVALGQCVAGALGEAHGTGLVHRDVKPQNIWLRAGDPRRAVLLDFGIARDTTSHEELTQLGGGSLVGSPRYMSPEQAQGLASIDARSDVFSLATVLFKCLTGTTPFPGREVIAILARIVLDPAPSVSSMKPDTPPALDALVARMLSKSPEDRPADGNAVLHALERLDAREAHAPEGPTATTRISKREQRWVSVLMIASGVPAVSAGDATVVQPNLDALDGALAELAARSGARYVTLIDGARVMCWSTGGVATDLACRAARAALDVRALAGELPMALSTGRATASDEVPVGEALDRAAALIASSPAARVSLDVVSASLVDARFDLGEAPDCRTLVGERTTTEQARRVLGVEVPCEGREQELATLAASWQHVVEGHGARVELISGDALIGKSRLRAEFTRRLRETTTSREPCVAQADAFAKDALAMFRQMVRQLVGLREGEPSATSRDKLRARLALSMETERAARTYDFLAEFLRLPGDDDALTTPLRAARSDSMLLGDQLRAALVDFLLAEARLAPLLVFWEDAHWADAASTALLLRVVRQAGSLPLLVLAIARPEIHDMLGRPFSGDAVVARVLRPLPRDACVRVACAVLRAAPGDPRVVAAVEHSDGHPFLLEEFLRANERTPDAPTPESVLAMVDARLRGLAPDERLVLRAASVLGNRFSEPALAHMLGSAFSSATLRLALSTLARDEWLSQRGEGEFSFRQSTVRDAAYAELVAEDRRNAHRLAAEWLVASHDDDAARVAQHLEYGELAERAAPLWAEAATRALAANDFPATVAHAERAIRCGVTGDARVRAELSACEAERWTGHLHESIRWAREVATRSDAPSDARLRAWSIVSRRAFGIGDRQAQVHAAKLVLAAISRAEAGKVELLAGATVGFTLWLAAEVHLAEQVTAQCDAIASELGEVPPELAAPYHELHAMRASTHGDQGAHVASLRRAEDAYERCDNARQVMVVRGNLGYALLLVGAHDEAISHSARSLNAADHLQLFSLATQARQNLGVTLGRVGRLEEGISLIRQSVAGFEQGAERAKVATGRAALSELLLRTGDIDAAMDSARAAIEAVEHLSPARAFAPAALADVLLERGDPTSVAAAFDLARGAYEIVAEHGDAMDRAVFVRRVWIDALVASGRHAEASEVRKRERERVLERVARISDERYRMSYLHDEPDNARILASGVSS